MRKIASVFKQDPDYMDIFVPHELGHAVTAYLLGAKNTVLSMINPQGGVVLGYTTYNLPLKTAQDYVNELLITVSGYVFANEWARRQKRYGTEFEDNSRLASMGDIDLLRKFSNKMHQLQLLPQWVKRKLPLLPLTTWRALENHMETYGVHRLNIQQKQLAQRVFSLVDETYQNPLITHCVETIKKIAAQIPTSALRQMVSACGNRVLVPTDQLEIILKQALPESVLEAMRLNLVHAKQALLRGSSH